ncbi:MAG: cobaltochelatase subunit CobN [Thermoplasmata archaeon]|nr:cobaltochelatase subunit CobN [Thermoplasmata archaeon]
MSPLKVVYISVQSADSSTIKAGIDLFSEATGIQVELYHRNGEQVDDDPLTYHELTLRVKEADLVLIRCMADPTKMKRFEKLEKVLDTCPGYVMIHSGSGDVALLYRDLFKGTDEDFLRLRTYLSNRCKENDAGVFHWLQWKLTGTGNPPEPVTTREDGIYHPDFDENITLEEYLKHLVPGRPTIGILYTSNLWIYNNQEHIIALIRKMESLGMNVIPVFFSVTAHNADERLGTRDVVKRYFMDGDKRRVDAIAMCTAFSQINNSRDCYGIYTPDEQNFFHTLTDIPVMQVMMISGHFADYEETTEGLSKAELSMSIIWPELDGQIITVPIASNESGKSMKRYSPIDDRIDHLAKMMRSWAILSRTPRSERRIAILMYQSRPETGRIGGAAGLDSIESISDMLKRFGKEGYTLDHVPENGKALIDEIVDNITNDLEWSSSERVREKAVALVDNSDYLEHYNRLSEFNRNMMERSWGKPPGEISVDSGKFVIPGIVNGNIYIGFQPLRGWAEQMEAVYHDPLIPCPHQYLEFYRWLKNDFKANVVFHIGTHGTLEWLPGKNHGLSSKCFPDLVLDGIPHIYPYIIDDPGEGIQCKRRSEAVLIGHMCPTMTRAGSYDDISAVDEPLQSYFRSKASQNDERKKAMLTEILEALKKSDMLRDLNLDSGITAEELEYHLDDIHEYITEVKDALIRDGLHILGRAPEGELLDEMIYGLMRLRNGDVPSLRASFYASRSYDIDALLESPSSLTGGEVNGLIIDRLDSELMGLLAQMREKDYDLDSCIGLFDPMTDDLRASVVYVCSTLSKNISKMSDEMDNIIHACDGGYVLPGPSGAPMRGNAHILPMGRNYYSVDPDTIPPKSSWEIGRKMADQMIQRYIDDKGMYPQEVGFIIWATDTMKTNGDDVAYILWLMGVRPVWSETGGQVTGLEVIPLSELGRPRIDVTVRITGLFRDAFPNLIDLIDDAVRMVSELDEDDKDNYLAANLRRDIVESLANGMTVDEARKKNSVRIFGCPPGAYGAGVNHAIEYGDWKTVRDLADIYMEWGSYAYGRGMSGVQMKDQFMKRFGKVGITVKNVPDREIDVLDVDDFYSYLGGLNAFVKAYGNQDAVSFMGDGSDPDKVKLRDSKQELQFVYRSKALNPKYINGLKQHGFRGVAEVTNLTEFTFGWDATSDIADDWMYQGLAEKYLFDPETREWMEESNPYATMEMVNRLMEAYDRGMWNADPETIEKLKDLFMDLEERIEGLQDKS